METQSSWEAHAARLNLNTKHAEDLTSAVSHTSTRREKRHGDRPKGRKTPAAGRRDGWVKEVVCVHNEQHPLFISVQNLVDVEMELV